MERSRAQTVAERRARRTEQVADLRRREIVEAAAELFGERGYHETGIADIARQLGMGHGTFYRYFENKRDILDAVIDDLVDRTLLALTVENAPEAATSLDEYRAQVRRIVGALWELLDANPAAMRMLLLQAGSVDAELKTRLGVLFGSMVKLIAVYLENGRERGFLRADLDETATAEALLGLIAAGLLRELGGDALTTREGFTDAAIALMFDGVATGR